MSWYLRMACGLVLSIQGVSAGGNRCCLDEARGQLACDMVYVVSGRKKADREKRLSELSGSLTERWDESLRVIADDFMRSHTYRPEEREVRLATYLGAFTWTLEEPARMSNAPEAWMPARVLVSRATHRLEELIKAEIAQAKTMRDRRPLSDSSE